MPRKETAKKMKKQTVSSIQSFIQNARNVFPNAKKDNIVSELIRKWKRSQEPTVFHFPEFNRAKLPFNAPIGILSSDWPGLSDSCIGVFHGKGWNLSSVEGFIIQYEHNELGIVLLTITLKTKEELQRFNHNRPHILRDLRVVATGSKAKTSLLACEVKKREIYGHVIEKIKTVTTTQREREAILKDEGEALKFFASRSESYLEERKYSDLAQQIVMNYRFLQRVRKTGGRPQFLIKNIKTTREHLTGITIVAFERDISLNDWLEAIYLAVPDYTIKYNKEFVTADGIVVYRIEMWNKKQKPYSKKKIQDIKRALMKAHIARRMERVQWMELMGGFEHYLRAIIPLLIKEYSLSRKPQVYINIAQMTTFLAKFKILVVTGISSTRKTGNAYTITETMEKENGMSIISAKPPKKYGDVEVDIIDIGADLDSFTNIEDIYKIIRRCIRSVIGDFRDFDEGMRKLEVTKLLSVKEKLKSYPENFVREFYYRLDDFYRIGADPDEIAEQIKLGIRGLELFETTSKRYLLITKEYSTKLGVKVIPNSTILVLVYSSRMKLLSHVLELLREYEVTLSRIERRNVTVVILRIQQDNKPIPHLAIENIEHFFETIPSLR